MSILKASLQSDWAYLRKQEWSMGNGQCPECHAKGPSWLGFGGWGLEIGHREDCALAAVLKRLGQEVVYEMEYARLPSEGFGGRQFGAVDWDNPLTQALMRAIHKAHPDMVERAAEGKSEGQK